MVETNFWMLFIIGFLGGGHCIGMCGGIVSALSLNIRHKRRLWQNLLYYNIGRILSYTIIGALLGSIAALGLSLTDTRAFQIGLSILANAMLVAMGLYLTGQPNVIHLLERLGQPIWRHIQPILARLLPKKQDINAILVGALWGWLPCGLVYSASLSALATGSTWKGAALMACFGLGTLPNLLIMGGLAGSLRLWLQKKWLRWVCGGLITMIGIIQLIQLFQPIRLF